MSLDAWLSAAARNSTERTARSVRHAVPHYYSDLPTIDGLCGAPVGVREGPWNPEHVQACRPCTTIALEA